MKVILHYQDNENSDLHKSLKITLPKKWKSGPTNRILSQFVESYNDSSSKKKKESVEAEETEVEEGETHQYFTLNESDLYLSLKDTKSPLASDAIVLTSIPDRSDLYIMHGKSQTVSEMNRAKSKSASDNTTNNDSNSNEKESESESKKDSDIVTCSRFGCNIKFPRGGPFPPCSYHTKPPVFHETAKFWSCCPHKKAYDWDQFQEIPGCMQGFCMFREKDDPEHPANQQNGKKFLGGCDLREIAAEKAGQKLKSIDDFNTSQLNGGSSAAPVLSRLKSVLKELDIDNELFDQVVEGIRKEEEQKLGAGAGAEDVEDAEVINAIASNLGQQLKDALKTIAREQLRIK